MLAGDRFLFLAIALFQAYKRSNVLLATRAKQLDKLQVSPNSRFHPLMTKLRLDHLPWFRIPIPHLDPIDVNGIGVPEIVYAVIGNLNLRRYAGVWINALLQPHQACGNAGISDDRLEPPRGES